MALGARDTGQLVMLTGWDATALKNFQLEDGTNFATIVANERIGDAGLRIDRRSLWAGTIIPISLT